MKIILSREEILRWASALKSEKGKNVESMTLEAECKLL